MNPLLVSQPHLKLHMDSLTLAEQDQFLADLQRYSLHLQEQRDQLSRPRSPLPIDGLNQFEMAGSLQDQDRGQQLIAQGKVACLILAGGQGSRLGISGPKGLFPISPIKQKTLFQIFLEKIAAASARAGRSLPVAIMTSPLNHEATKSYLEHHLFFGLQQPVDLFSQQMMPFLDDAGNWLLQAPGQLAVGPNGNGQALELLFHSPIFAKWKNSGVEKLIVIPIDNPLADPFDDELCGFHDRKQADVTLKCIQIDTKTEKIGIVGARQGKTVVAEYSELPALSQSKQIGHIGLLCFDLSFIPQAAAQSLPWHLARKITSVYGADGKKTVPVWKFEKFIFDLLPCAQQVEVLVYPREKVYCPLKELQGVSAVQMALHNADCQAFYNLSGVMPSQEPFELDPAFHYPTIALKKKWAGKSLPATTYIFP